MSKWVDVKQELPPVEHEVLVLYTDNNEPLQTQARISSIDGRTFFCEPANEYIFDVTHWQELLPLPAASDESKTGPQGEE